MMNKLEHKCNVLENGGIETAIDKNYGILSKCNTIFFRIKKYIFKIFDI